MKLKSCFQKSFVEAFGVDGFIGVQRHHGRIPHLLHDTDRHLCSARCNVQCADIGSAWSILQCAVCKHRYIGSGVSILHCTAADKNALSYLSNELSAGLVTHFKARCMLIIIVITLLIWHFQYSLVIICSPHCSLSHCLHHPPLLTTPSSSHLHYQSCHYSYSNKIPVL